MMLTIYVPRPGSSVEQQLLPGSAIVGDPSQGGGAQVLCYYEGNKYGSSSMPDLFSKLCIAAGRLVQRYPTVAMAAFDADEVVPVGTYDGDRFVVTAITDPGAVRAWSGEDPATVFGPRLPGGRTDWATAAALATPELAKPIGRHSAAMTEAWYKTRSGQVLRFDLLAQSAEVFEHDDPALPAALRALRLTDDELRHVVGAGPASPRPAL